MHRPGRVHGGPQGAVPVSAACNCSPRRISPRRYAAVLEALYLHDLPREGLLATALRPGCVPSAHHGALPPPTGLLAAALPLPAASSTGRDRLSSSFDAWSLVLRQRPGDAHASAQRAPLACVSRMQVLTTAPVFPPGDAHASVRLALVEAELAFQSSTAGANDAEARRHLRSALDRMEKVIATDDR